MDKIKNLKFKSLVYPAIFFFALIVITVIFIFSVKFFLKTIGGVFDVDEGVLDSQIVKVDMDNFSRVAKKLGIEVVTSSEQVAGEEKPAAEEDEEENIIQPVIIDKQRIKIAVYNATKEKGLANEVKKELEVNGFVVDKVGNFFLGGKSVLKVKKEFDMIGDEIKGVVEKKYPSGMEKEILSEEEEYGIIIIIGSKK